jgi:hypothetical protein
LFCIYLPFKTNLVFLVLFCFREVFLGIDFSFIEDFGSVCCKCDILVFFTQILAKFRPVLIIFTKMFDEFRLYLYNIAKWNGFSTQVKSLFTVNASNNYRNRDLSDSYAICFCLFLVHGRSVSQIYKTLSIIIFHGNLCNIPQHVYFPHN